MAMASDIPASEVQTACDDGLIFDIGMDLCQDTDFYLQKGFRVVAVDANPLVCANAHKRYASEIAAGQLTIVNRVISEAREPLPFYVCGTLSALSTADVDLRRKEERNGHVFEEIEVLGATAADILTEFGVPYFAKIDIEGFDLICLQGFLRARGRPKYISTEVDFQKFGAQIACLRALGYRKFALVSQVKAPLHRPPRPALEGRDVDYSFAHHASGLFGRELPESWVGVERLRAKCRAIYWRFRLSGLMKRFEAIPPLKSWMFRTRLRLFPNAGDWYDIHATF
jgi:FkbM family methyltransferase